MTSFAERLSLAEKWEHEVADALRSRGWAVESYGQALLTPLARKMLRRDPHAQHRWLPDLLAARDAETVLVDAKARMSSTASPNHSIEKSALAALIEHERNALMPLFIVFHDWAVVRACELWEMTDNPRICWTGPPSRKGSGTPYWLIPKRVLPRNFDNTFGLPRRNTDAE